MGDFIKNSGTQKWINIFGDVQIIQGLERLKTTGQRKIVRRAIAAGIKPIAAAAKANAPKKKGHLAAAIKSKVTKMVSGKVYVDPNYVIAKTQDGESFKVKMYGQSKLKSKGKQAFLNYAKRNNMELIRPAKYAHLVEFGTKNAAPHPFMRPALQQGRSSALAAIEQGARQGLQEALK